MSLKAIAVTLLLLQALALPGAALAGSPAPEPARGVVQAGTLTFPGWNYGVCWYAYRTGDKYTFYVYNGSTFVGQFWTTDGVNDVAPLAHECGNAHSIAIYCPDANCDWSLWTYPWGAYYPQY
jgi:hypothetical protein